MTAGVASPSHRPIIRQGRMMGNSPWPCLPGPGVGSPQQSTLFPDCYQRVVISSPTVCSGRAASRSWRVAWRPTESADAGVAGTRRQPSR